VKIGIFHTAFLGDIVLCGLLVEALHREKNEIYFITSKNHCLIYKNDFRIKKLIPVEKKKGLKKLGSIFNIAKEINKLNLDVLLVPHKSLTSSLCVFLTKVPQKISYYDSTFRFVYNKLINFDKKKHECLRCLDLAAYPLVSKEIFSEVAQIRRPLLVPGKTLDNFYYYHHCFAKDKNLFFIVSPGSAWETKKYPAIHLAEVIRLILEKNKKIYCVLTGTLKEKQDIETIFDYFSNFSHLLSRIIDTSFHLPLDEFVTLVSKSEFIITNDSMATHVASGLDKPVAAIFGATSGSFGFFPSSNKSVLISYKDQNGQSLSCHPCSPHGTRACPLKHFRCMKDLKPEVVFENIVQLVPLFFV